MQVSLQSAVCLTTCTLISAYSAYSNYLSWVSCFAFGIIWGYNMGQNALEKLDNHPDAQQLNRAVKFLTNSMPDITVTAIHLVALGFISQRIQSPSELGIRLATIFCSGLASLAFGMNVGKLFQLDILRRSENPQIQELLKKAII